MVHLNSGNNIGAKIRLAAIFSAILLGFTLITGCALAPVGEYSADTNQTGTALYDESAVTELYRKAIQAVVEVRVFANHSAFSDAEGPVVPTGQGSGFIIDQSGDIITNNHVVEGASEVRVILRDERIVIAEVIGTAPQNDIALLRISSEDVAGIEPLALGDSSLLMPGQMAIALGSPFGLTGSVTVGVISGLGRSINGDTNRLIADVIQTDAAINPGNSGGPLLNSRGEVIGINTAIEPASNGIGFVVPVNTIKSLLPSLKEGGEIRSPWLGISALALTDDLAAEIGLTADEGIYIVDIVENSPAEDAGLIAAGQDEQGIPDSNGDIVTEIDGHKVTRVNDVIAYLNTRVVGDVVTLTVIRDGATTSIEVTLGSWPDLIP